MLADNKIRHSHDSYIPSLCSSSVSSLNIVSNQCLTPNTPTTPTTPTAVCSNHHHTADSSAADNNTVKHKRWDESPFAIELCDDYIYSSNNKNHHHDHQHISLKQKFRNTFSSYKHNPQHHDTSSLYTSSSIHNTSNHLFPSSAPSTTSFSSFYSSPSYSSSSHGHGGTSRKLHKVSSSFKRLKNILSLS